MSTHIDELQASQPHTPSPRRQRLREGTQQSWFLIGLALVVWGVVGVRERAETGAWGERRPRYERREDEPRRVVPPWQEADQMYEERMAEGRR